MLSNMMKSVSTLFGSTSESKEIDPLNGSKLKHIYLPDELLIELLARFDSKSLLKCRRVCNKWKSLIDGDVLRYKAMNYTQAGDVTLELYKTELPWQFWYTCLSARKPFYRNLIVNPCGHDKLNGWTIKSNGGDHFTVEQPPSGCEPLPDNVQFTKYTTRYFAKPDAKKERDLSLKMQPSCFATSYGMCAKHQMIDLNMCPGMIQVIDQFKPIIVYNDWICRRFDCGGLYNLKVLLLDENKRGVLDSHIHSAEITAETDLSWKRVEHKFENYPTGVRYILFEHSGVDTQFWAGHYGTKMTRACVFIVPPGLSYEISTENNVPLGTENVPIEHALHFYRPVLLPHDGDYMMYEGDNWEGIDPALIPPAREHDSDDSDDGSGGGDNGADAGGD